MKSFSNFIKEAKGLWQQNSVFFKTGQKYAEKGKEKTHPDGQKKLSHQEYYDLPREARKAYREKYGNVYEDFSLKPKTKKELDRREKLINIPQIQDKVKGKNIVPILKKSMGKSDDTGSPNTKIQFYKWTKYIDKMSGKKPKSIRKFFKRELSLD
jgi:hypothetical protein